MVIIDKSVSEYKLVNKSKIAVQECQRPQFCNNQWESIKMLLYIIYPFKKEEEKKILLTDFLSSQISVLKGSAIVYCIVSGVVICSTA